jgi:hypothetical protein
MPDIESILACVYVKRFCVLFSTSISTLQQSDNGLSYSIFQLISAIQTRYIFRFRGTSLDEEDCEGACKA